MVTRAERRKNLEAKLIETAGRQIAANGLAAMTARSVATEADIALGSIYSAFPDLNGLFMAVNLESFEQLARRVARAILEEEPETPHARLLIMARTYLDFAMENRNRWKALFDIEMSRDSDLPELYRNSVAGLLQLIGGPVKEIYPSLPPEDIDARSRALFSAVHGIVSLGLDARLSAVSEDQMHDMIGFIVENVK